MAPDKVTSGSGRFVRDSSSASSTGTEQSRLQPASPEAAVDLCITGRSLRTFVLPERDRGPGLRRKSAANRWRELTKKSTPAANEQENSEEECVGYDHRRNAFLRDKLGLVRTAPGQLDSEMITLGGHTTRPSSAESLLLSSCVSPHTPSPFRLDFSRLDDEVVASPSTCSPRASTSVMSGSSCWSAASVASSPEVDKAYAHTVVIPQLQHKSEASKKGNSYCSSSAALQATLGGVGFDKTAGAERSSQVSQSLQASYYELPAQSMKLSFTHAAKMAQEVSVTSIHAGENGADPSQPIEHAGPLRLPGVSHTASVTEISVKNGEQSLLLEATQLTRRLVVILGKLREEAPAQIWVPPVPTVSQLVQQRTLLRHVSPVPRRGGADLEAMGLMSQVFRAVVCQRRESIAPEEVEEWSLENSVACEK